MWKVAIIIGSTRPNRIGVDIANWVLCQVAGTKDLEFDLVDLKEWFLPDDEPALPSIQQYLHEHTKAWSRKINSADGYIFVTPQYNWGYPAALKNAIDHLYKEWLGKPAVIVSYGHRGGGKAAPQLRQVLEGLKMRPTVAMPALTFKNEMLDESGRLKQVDIDFSQYADGVAAAAEELAEALRSNPRPG